MSCLTRSRKEQHRSLHGAATLGPRPVEHTGSAIERVGAWTYGSAPETRLDLRALQDCSQCSFKGLARTMAAVDDDNSGGLRERKKRAARVETHRAALELVAERGLGGVTVEMIAERAGISPRTFFNHWTTKEAALLGVVFTDADGIGDALRARPAEEAPTRALRAVLREWMRMVPSDTELRELRKQVMGREPTLHAMNAGRVAEFQGGLIAALQERLAGEDSHARAIVHVQIAIALTRSAFTLSMTTGSPLDEEFDRVLRLFDAGVVEV